MNRTHYQEKATESHCFEKFALVKRVYWRCAAALILSNFENNIAQGTTLHCI